MTKTFFAAFGMLWMALSILNFGYGLFSDRPIHESPNFEAVLGREIRNSINP